MKKGLDLAGGLFEVVRTVVSLSAGSAKEKLAVEAIEFQSGSTARTHCEILCLPRFLI